MQIATNINDLTLSRGACITIGNFDGVHLGHRALVETATRIAMLNNLELVAITFYPHPRQVLGLPHHYLNTREDRGRLLEQAGISNLIEIPFTPELSAMYAEDFIVNFLLPLRLRHLVVGHDFTLGRKREGDVELLRKLAEKYGYKVSQAKALEMDGQPVSSTRLRERILAGDVAAANRLLGRRYSLTGNVAHGFARGRALGFPTANIVATGALLPANGVYATFAHVEDRCMPAVTNIGGNPTFGANSLSIETHFLDASVDLYGERLRVEFVERLRPEHKFASAAELVEQIKMDVGRVRQILASGI